MKLGKGAQRALDGMAHCDRFDWVFRPGGGVRKRDVEKLVSLGLAEDAGMAAMVDGDGFTIQPERYRQCWRFTDAGRAEAKRQDDEWRASLVRDREAA